MKELEKQNILYFTRTMELGGTENVILQLCEIFNPLVNNIVVCSCGGVNVKKLDELGIKHYTIPDIENKSLNTVISVIRTLKKVVKKENISIIHTHHRMAAFYVTLLNLYKKCVFINTSHNTFSNKVILTKFAYKHANMVACGKMVKKNLVETFGLPYQQITVIHNAVKAFDKEVKSDLFISKLHKKGYSIVGNVGRLSEQKGMEYFIHAIPAIKKKISNVKFVIIGSGEDERKLKQLVNKLNLQEDCYFLGYRTDIQNLMSQLDLVVLSSLWEGLPLTPIEAFSVGKTIVATAVDGTVEIINDKVNGLLISPKNSNAISEGVISLLSNDFERQDYEIAAKRTYEKEFSFSSFTYKYRDFYKEKIHEFK